jgi:ankyrin repeat protein
MKTPIIKAILLGVLLVPCSLLFVPAFAQTDADILDMAVDGKTAEVTALISRANANLAQSDGTSLLHWAVYYNDAALVEALLERGADLHTRNDYGATPMSQAAILANPDVLALLLAAGADPNEKGADDQTPLMIVARTDNVAAAEVLLAAGADVNVVEQWRGQTALMWAAAQQQPAMVKRLLEAGADPDAQSLPNNWERQVTAEPRMKVLPAGGLTPLLYAAREGCTECVRLLIAGGADINKPDPDAITPLLMANLNAHWDSAKLLIEAGAWLDKWDMWGRNPLYAAVDYNTLPHGGRPDHLSSDLTTALEIMQMILERGGNPNLQLKLFPPYRALGPDRGADGLLRTGATPLFRAARGADVAAMRVLLAHDALVDLSQENDVTPLIAAAGYLQSGIDTRGRFRDEDNAIPAVELLLAHGADVHARTDVGQTALFGAAINGWTEIVKMLVAAGADPSAMDDRGNSVLDAALGRGGRFGRGAGGDPHPETAAVLEQLIAQQP